MGRGPGSRGHGLVLAESEALLGRGSVEKER